MGAGRCAGLSVRPGVMGRLLAGAKQVVGWIFALALLVGGTLLFGDQLLYMPDNAKLLMNDSTLTYASLPCALRGEVEARYIKRDDPEKHESEIYDEVYELTRAQIRERYGKTATSDAKCRDGSGFFQKETFWQRIFGHKSRWTTDGNWRW